MILYNLLVHIHIVVQNPFFHLWLKILLIKQLKIRQAEAYEFDVMDMNGGPIYACACAEALPRLFTMIGAPNSCAPENITGTENAVSAVTKI
ncbi:unnamed protein product [Rotaria magnacalcarata]|uniref:Uncharacterized protein n=1 Tax=Rotaria magnacalcarata TaxID=392030 RepID=A0A814YCY4_9BILA|nr:unnamed protein product [Rotaria magnacalcarata]CAF1902360.1 unnamed protein product [Rotaria magnacalcarata]CAF1962589.1 unnamed protein product [Rotaria magnacalcarata]